jgi:hypothetical protein
MAILIEIVFIIAAIITILAFLKPKDKEENHTTPKPTGLYKAIIEVNGEECEIKTEVTLDKDYGEGEISVKHTKIFGLPKDKLELAMETLLTEHTLISKEDVKWKM